MDTSLPFLLFDRAWAALLASATRLEIMGNTGGLSLLDRQGLLMRRQITVDYPYTIFPWRQGQRPQGWRYTLGCTIDEHLSPWPDGQSDTNVHIGSGFRACLLGLQIGRAHV